MMTQEKIQKIEDLMTETYKIARKVMEQGDTHGYRSCMGKILGIAEAVQILEPDYCVIEPTIGVYKVVTQGHAMFTGNIVKE